MKNKIQVLFPNHFYTDGPCPLLSHERVYLDSLRERLINNIGGNKTSSENYILESDNLKALKSWLQDCINEYVHDFMKIDEESEFYITQSWVNFNKKGEGHHSHVHSNSIISGVFYVDGDEDSPITFTRDNIIPFFGGNFEYNIKEYNVLNSKVWTMTNKKNHLVLFPSTIGHSVERNNSDKERISISFNTFVRGTLGQNKKLTELKL